MKCLILAAGQATRMRPLTDRMPKCLLPVGGKPILQRMIENVLAAGIGQIGLVIGFERAALRSFVRRQFPSHRIRFIVNPRYESTNNAFSLLLGRDFHVGGGEGADDLLLLDADIVFSSELLPYFLGEGSPNRIAVRVRGPHDDEEVKVKIDAAGKVCAIGKAIPPAESYGESVGIEFFSAAAAQRLFEILEQRVRQGKGRTEYYEASFQAMVDAGVRFTGVDVSSFPALEIDTPEDLAAAEALAASFT